MSAWPWRPSAMADLHQASLLLWLLVRSTCHRLWPSSSPFMEGFWDTALAGCSIPPHPRASCTVYTSIAINLWINLLPPDLESRSSTPHSLSRRWLTIYCRASSMPNPWRQAFHFCIESPNSFGNLWYIIIDYTSLEPYVYPVLFPSI